VWADSSDTAAEASVLYIYLSQRKRAIVYVFKAKYLTADSTFPTRWSRVMINSTCQSLRTASCPFCFSKYRNTFKSHSTRNRPILHTQIFFWLSVPSHTDPPTFPVQYTHAQFLHPYSENGSSRFLRNAGNYLRITQCESYPKISQQTFQRRENVQFFFLSVSKINVIPSSHYVPPNREITI